MSTLRSILVIPAQLIAGVAAAGAIAAIYPGPMDVDTVLGGGTSITPGLFIEVFFTAQLVFVILMLAVEKQRSTYLAPLGIGIAFFLTELSGVFISRSPRSMSIVQACLLTCHDQVLLHRRISESCSVPGPATINHSPRVISGSTGSDLVSDHCSPVHSMRSCASYTGRMQILDRTQTDWMLRRMPRTRNETRVLVGILLWLVVSRFEIGTLRDH